MDSDTSTTPSPSTETERVSPYLESDIMHEEKRDTDYMSTFGDALTSTTRTVTDFFASRPLLTGSIAVGAVGAFLGSRAGHMLAMRRRKSFYDRLMDNIGLFVATMGTAFSKQNREKAVGKIVDTSRGVIESTGEVRSTIMDRVPAGAGSVVEMVTPEERPSTMKQIGYAVSLVPVTVALLRNPLVRNMGFRVLARRVRPGRRR